LSETYETLGIPTPLEFLEQDERQVISRYFAALQASQTQDEFFDQALHFLVLHEQPTDLESFLALVGSERLALQAYLEAWADRLIRNALSTPYDGLAFQLRLLLRFYEQDGRTDDVRNLWVLFRRMYPACYTRCWLTGRLPVIGNLCSIMLRKPSKSLTLHARSITFFDGRNNANEYGSLKILRKAWANECSKKTCGLAL
jgi:hypothetical protein